jgi:hypothetical protein
MVGFSWTVKFLKIAKIAFPLLDCNANYQPLAVADDATGKRLAPTSGQAWSSCWCRGICAVPRSATGPRDGHRITDIEFVRTDVTIPAKELSAWDRE